MIPDMTDDHANAIVDALLHFYMKNLGMIRIHTQHCESCKAKADLINDYLDKKFNTNFYGHNPGGETLNDMLTTKNIQELLDDFFGP